MFGFSEVETDCKDVLGARHQQPPPLLFLCFCRFPLATVESNDYNQGDTRSCGSVTVKTSATTLMPNVRDGSGKVRGEGRRM